MDKLSTQLHRTLRSVLIFDINKIICDYAKQTIDDKIYACIDTIEEGLLNHLDNLNYSTEPLTVTYGSVTGRLDITLTRQYHHASTHFNIISQVRSSKALYKKSCEFNISTDHDVSSISNHNMIRHDIKLESIKFIVNTYYTTNISADELILITAVIVCFIRFHNKYLPEKLKIKI